MGTEIVSGIRAAANGVTSGGVDEELRAALFYTKGQSLGGAHGDEQFILDALGNAGLRTELIDIGQLSHARDGSFLLRNPVTNAVEPWAAPHAALMYHGAIAPANAALMLDSLAASGTQVVTPRQAWEIFTDKAVFAKYMTARGVDVIPTTEVSGPAQLRAAVEAQGGEAIVKKAISTEGDEINVIRSAADLDALAARMHELGDGVLVQPLIDSRIGRDLEPGLLAKIEAKLASLPRDPGSRAPTLEDVLGRRHEFRINTTRLPDGNIDVSAIYLRLAPDGNQVVNNIAQGAVGVRVTLDDLNPADRELVLRAAREAPPGGDIVGWDLIGQPGSRKIIEGNSGSGLANRNEGFDPAEIVRSYGTVVRAAAERSPLLATR